MLETLKTVSRCGNAGQCPNPAFFYDITDIPYQFSLNQNFPFSFNRKSGAFFDLELPRETHLVLCIHANLHGIHSGDVLTANNRAVNIRRKVRVHRTWGNLCITSPTFPDLSPSTLVYFGFTGLLISSLGSGNCGNSMFRLRPSLYVRVHTKGSRTFYFH